MPLKRVLITGAKGYIGSLLIHYLVKNGYECVALVREGDVWDLPIDIEVRKCNLLNTTFLSEALQDIDTIFHFAGLKNFDQCAKQMNKAVESNIMLTDRLLSAVKRRDVKIIFSSTYWVYGYKSELPYRENAILMPTEPYGWTKALAERMVITSGLNYIIIRLTNIFGYGMGRGYEEVTSIFLKNAFTGGTISLKNNGEHRIDLIYIDDVCKVLIDIIKLEEKNLILNTGSGIPISISELADSVNVVSKKFTGNKAQILRDITETDKTLFADRWVDISKLKKLTGFTPTPLITALEKFANNLLSEGPHEKRA